MNQNQLCPSCNLGSMRVFHSVQGVPTNSCILLDSKSDAVGYPRGDIALAFCPVCGFISNMAFDPKLTEYSGRYEETQGYSPTFNAFQQHLAKRLVDRYDLRGKDLLEIGCGKGEFLTLLTELGNNRGVGFDPGFHEGRQVGPSSGRTEFIRDFYSEKYSDRQADFVCCKMTLEHIHPTGDFMKMVRRAIGDRPDTIVFFQVPDAARILHDCAFEDVYYEHCSYFSTASLGRLFQSCGFEVLDINSEYGGQYLTIEARPSAGLSPAAVNHDDELEQLRRYADGFSTRFKERVQTWRDLFDRSAKNGHTVVLWGSGSKGVAFLTTLGLVDEVEYVVDINPYRHGHFMPGTGQKIIAPETLQEILPDLVVVMNPLYCQEIRTQLEGLGLYPEIVAT